MSRSHSSLPKELKDLSLPSAEQNPVPPHHSGPRPFSKLRLFDDQGLTADAHDFHQKQGQKFADRALALQNDLVSETNADELSAQLQGMGFNGR